MRQQREERVDNTDSYTKDTQLSTLVDSMFRERRVTLAQQMQELFNSKKFKETLGQIMAPQVNNLIEPPVKNTPNRNTIRSITQAYTQL